MSKNKVIDENTLLWSDYDQHIIALKNACRLIMQGNIKAFFNYMKLNPDLELNWNTIIPEGYYEGTNKTLFKAANSKGLKEIAEFLLNKVKQKDLEPTDIYYNTPLHAAVLIGNIDLISKFTGWGLNINETNNEEFTPLHMAVRNNQLDVLDILIANRGKLYPNKNLSFEAEINLALKSDNLLTNTIIQEVYKQSLAAYQNKLLAENLENLENVLQNDDLENFTSLQSKIGNSFLSLANYENKDVLSILGSAIAKNSFKIFEHLLSQNSQLPEPVDINLIRDDDHKTLLHGAASHGHFNIVQLLLLQYQANVNAQDNNGLTPLHMAVLSNNTKNDNIVHVIKLLIEYKADISLKDKKNYTPSELAKNLNDPETVKLILAEQSQAIAVEERPFELVVNSNDQTPEPLEVLGLHSDANITLIIN